MQRTWSTIRIISECLIHLVSERVEVLCWIHVLCMVLLNQLIELLPSIGYCEGELGCHIRTQTISWPVSHGLPNTEIILRLSLSDQYQFNPAFAISRPGLWSIIHYGHLPLLIRMLNKYSWIDRVEECWHEHSHDRIWKWIRPDLVDVSFHNLKGVGVGIKNSFVINV